MKSKNSLMTLALLFIAIFTFGQTSDLTNKEVPYIEVTGTAEKDLIPDEIYIGITIREKYEGKKKVTIEDQEEKLITIIKTLGIDLKNLYLSDANADKVKIRFQKNDILTKKDYTLKVSNATTVGQIFFELEKLEITDANIVKVSHSQMDSLRKEVKILAIKAAKNKADYLLNAIGEQTGKPLLIRENEISTYRTLSNVNTININENESFDNLKNKEDDEIQFSKIKIQSSIYVKFSIK
jgi:uncharacterized protein